MNRIPVVREMILAERSVLGSLSWTALAVIVPTSIRWFVDKGESGIPFVTYFPAVLVATVLLGWRYGALVAALSGIVANRLLREQPTLFYISTRDAVLVALFVLSCAIIVWAGESLRRLVRQQERLRTREEILKRELLHRIGNIFAVIQSLASLTATHSKPEEFFPKFNSRLFALDRANRRLGSAVDNPKEIERLVEEAILPFREDGNFSLQGPNFELPTNSIVPLSLALHELCTNASKYGALSVPGGRVAIVWSFADQQGEHLKISWQEIGGPQVVTPTRKGLGSLLLRPQEGLEDVEVKFNPDGLRCDLLVSSAVEGRL